MGTAIIFSIPGRIAGKGRHRAVIRAGRIATYTPAKTVATEAVIRHYASQAMHRIRRFEGPVRLHITIYQHHPKSWPAKRKATAKWITGKPDLDNVMKALGDGMNNIVFADDAQIADLSIKRKFINAESVSPGFGEFVRVLIEGLGDDP